MYLKGRGVPRDEAQAVAWFQKAEAHGEKRAKTNLAFVEQSRQRQRWQDDVKAVMVAAITVFSMLIAYRIMRERSPSRRNALCNDNTM
jgi:TPR repeat protein